MAADHLTRRRAIGLLAAAAGLPLVLRASRATAEVVTWHGRALGAPATLILHHPDRAAAERLLARAALEVARLESIFSLYRADSALSELNRTGGIAAPAARARRHPRRLPPLPRPDRRRVRPYRPAALAPLRHPFRRRRRPCRPAGRRSR